MAKKFINKRRKRNSQRRAPTPMQKARPQANKVARRVRTPQETIIRKLEIRQETTIKQVYGRQRSQGGAPPIDQSPQESLNEIAKALLEGLGCTILSQQVYTQNHSLISDQTDTEMIENTNIIDHKLFDKLSPAVMNAGKNFKNFNDPIFKLDQPLPRAQTNIRAKAKENLSTPNVEMLTADLINLNINTRGGSVLKQFK